MTTQASISTSKLYLGIDIHQRSWRIQTATDLCLGKFFTSPPDSESLFSCVQTHFPEHRVYCAYGAGCWGFEPARRFIEYGWDTIFFNPADLPRPGTTVINKTDKIDARLICREFKDRRLHSINIPSRQREELKNERFLKKNLIGTLFQPPNPSI